MKLFSFFFLHVVLACVSAAFILYMSKKAKRKQ